MSSKQVNIIILLIFATVVSILLILKFAFGLYKMPSTTAEGKISYQKIVAEKKENWDSTLSTIPEFTPIDIENPKAASLLKGKLKLLSAKWTQFKQIYNKKNKAGKYFGFLKLISKTGKVQTTAGGKNKDINKYLDSFTIKTRANSSALFSLGEEGFFVVDQNSRLEIHRNNGFVSKLVILNGSILGELTSKKSKLYSSFGSLSNLVGSFYISKDKSSLKMRIIAGSANYRNKKHKMLIETGNLIIASSSSKKPKKLEI